MKFLPSTRWTTPKPATLSLALLAASLLALVGAVYFRVEMGIAAAPAGGRRELEKAARAAVFTELAAIDAARAKKAAELRRTLAELQLLLSFLAKPGTVATQAATVDQMRQAASRIGTIFSLPDEGGEEEEKLPESAEIFQAATLAFQQRAELPRERALAEEASRRFEHLLTVGAELRELHQRQAAEFQRLAGASALNPARNGAMSAMAARLGLGGWLLALLAATSFAGAAGTVYFGSRANTRPIKYLVDIARDVTHGRARRKAKPEETGELRDLAEAMNQMMDARDEAEERLRIANDSLELKVSARTAELWRANMALREESEQRGRAERDFHQAQKMDALGKLAGSIAHDFNNLLTVIIGGAECARKQLAAGHPTLALLHTIQQAGERAAGLTKPLLTFSRNQVLAVEVVDLNDSAQEAGRMLHRLLGVNIELRLELDSALHAVKTNPNQLQQVLINLGVNARDAMEGIGVLTVTTRNAVLEAAAAAAHGVPAADLWVELIVRDTGCGMDAETKARIFEPFFTTKPVGKGTGLGLATVFGIVKQAGGFLRVESAPGEGTAFHVFLPATTEAPAAAAAPAAIAPSLVPEQATETILLVDDEEEIRELAAITLEERGYRVFAAASAEDAITLAEQHRQEIRILMTDVVMPGINGVQLAELLSKIVPDLCVLFVSGHSNESISAGTLRATNAAYLQKPYRGEELLTKLREILTSGEARRRPPAIRSPQVLDGAGGGDASWALDEENPWAETGAYAREVHVA